jgi:hypothetical protein
MTLTVFKNFTRMSKNGVGLKSMGHRKDGVFALYSGISLMFFIQGDGGPGQTRTADLTIISRAL